VSDTIVALATPPGEAALAVMRISGSLVRSIIEGALIEKDRSPTLAPRLTRLSHYRNLSGKTLDHLVWVYYAGPKSFTGEDMLELISHGSPFIVQRLLEDLEQRGARQAEPGEFTKTAFVNGKMDLAQAEAVVDVIRARSEQSLKIAQQQLAGALGKHVSNLVERLLRVTAHLEAYIDFPDEDLPAEDVSGPVAELSDFQNAIDQLMATEQYRNRLQDGISVVLVGAPNAGKSSLLNRLVADDRAIVSEEAGTTRDFIEVRGTLGGHLVRYFDTAGLRDSGSKIEEAGMAKSLEMAKKADLILHIIDAQEDHIALDANTLKDFEKKALIRVLNKADLVDEASSVMDVSPSSVDIIRVSALTGDGLYDLQKALIRYLDTDFKVPEDADVAVSARHSAALAEVKSKVSEALGKLRAGSSIELAATDLHLAIEAIGRIVGRIDSEQMLDELFGSFCIGK
tara:strand:+ start:2002 stop:3369 length:1368 start_codon:yes stop_codon:yes gene_type:complete